MESKRKKRYQRIAFDSNVSFEKAKIVIASDDVNKIEMKIINENNKVFETNMKEIQEYYERDNGKDKIICTQPVKHKYINNINSELTKYEVILAIDTSYETIKNIKMAFTCILICTKISSVENDFYYKQMTNVLEWDATLIDKPENFMYVNAIENIRLYNIKKSQSPNIAVVIDSDLENIFLFNNRIKPIYSDYYLPEKFSLFYASSDTGNEYIQNKVMKACDKEAKIALQEYKINNGEI